MPETWCYGHLLCLFDSCKITGLLDVIRVQYKLTHVGEATEITIGWIAITCFVKKLALRRWKVKLKARGCSACDKDITDRESSVNEHGNIY